MQIDDILKKEEFRNLDSFLTEEMEKYAGNLVEKMEEVLGSKNSARDWFYSSLSSFGGKRPYDYCKKGKISEVETVLYWIEHGIPG